ncbi:T9SS type A sorting domain-containing protein [Cryomorphaceae bacterium 1068]|nr:T9SS type A sorting domain-containing protein [Cryomorphaceae bacterium 1068]
MHFTKMFTVCCAIVFGAFMTSNVMAQGGCLNTAAFASADITVEGPNGQLIGISTCSYEEEYSTITGVPAGEDIQFTLDADGDGGYITVRRDSAAGAIVAEGFSPLTVSAASGADLFPHWNTDDACGTLAQCVVTTVQCVSCDTQCPEGNIGDPCDDGDETTVGDTIGEDCVCAGLQATGDCLNSSAFGSADLSLAASEVVTISTCSFQTEYSEISGVVAGETYQLAIVEGGYITVRFDSLNGPVVAQGSSPLTFSASASNNLYAHWNTDGACQTATNCVTTTAQCTTCPATCPGGNIGDPCDDGDPLTEGSTIQPDCSCAGGTVPLANDDCDDVSSLLACGATVTGTTVGANQTEGLNNLCGGFTSTTPDDVWYAFQANGTDNYTVTVLPGEGSLIDAVLFIYSGDCESLTEVACSDTGLSAGSGEGITLEAPAAGVYYVRTYAYFDAGDITVSLDCESSCADPFPAVDEASLSTTFTGNSFLTEWDAVAGQIGCQIRVRLAGASSILGAQIIGGAGASSFNIPGGVLQPGTDYEWQVRCGCSQTPLVAGPFTTWQPFTTPGGAAISSLPNPTEGQSNVTFTVAEDSYTTLEVFDMSGRLVDGLFAGNAQAGNDYRFEFDGSNLPNGVYIYRLTTENEVVNDKFMIAK